MDFKSDKDFINVSVMPLIDLRQPKKSQPISKRKAAGWCFYIALNAVLLYVIYEGFVMRGAI